VNGAHAGGEQAGRPLGTGQRGAPGDPRRVDTLLRELAPRVLGALVRRHGHGQFGLCEDAVQEALIAAAAQWPADGLPEDPRAWLTTVADRRAIDAIRAERSRREREAAVAEAGGVEEARVDDADDTLRLLLLCCHPSLTPATQVALTLRAVGGLTTAQIASAFLLPEATVGQRISRAKRTIRAAGARFELPQGEELPDRLAAVLQVLYLIFNEGHTATSGGDLTRVALTAEAIRLTRELHALLPADGEVAGLLALMLLTDAHRDARVGADGLLVTLDRQDRTRWDRAQVEEGVALITQALAGPGTGGEAGGGARAGSDGGGGGGGGGPLGPYQVQAAIAAVHAEAPTAEATDWRQIVALYGVLERLAPGPMVALNRAAAIAMVEGPEAGLKLLDELARDERLTGHHRLAAVRAHLLERAGDRPGAAASFRAAARFTTSLPERRYLEAQAGRLG
jgi:RNA polymerase sigma factor (sigma-70 family)